MVSNICCDIFVRMDIYDTFALKFNKRCGDTGTGVYKRFEYPEHKKGIPVYPLNLKGSVAALVETDCQYPSRFIDLYVLDTNNSTWTKMFTIGPLVCERYFIPQSLRGELVVVKLELQTLNKVTHVCDPSTSSLIRNHDMEELNPSWHESYTHVESLVHVKGMVPIGNQHVDKVLTMIFICFS